MQLLGRGTLPKIVALTFLSVCAFGCGKSKSDKGTQGKVELEAGQDGEDATQQKAIKVNEEFSVAGEMTPDGDDFKLTHSYLLTIDEDGTFALESRGAATICIGNMSSSGPSYLLRGMKDTPVADLIISSNKVPGYKQVAWLYFPGKLVPGKYELDVIYTGSGACYVSGSLILVPSNLHEPVPPESALGLRWSSAHSP